MLGCASGPRPTRATASCDGAYERQPYFVNFVPFGAGQFQNGARGKGTGFAIAEGATGAASAGIFVYLASKYGLAGEVPIEDSLQVRSLQRIEIATGVAFFALYAAGIVDSLRHHEPYRCRGMAARLDARRSSRPLFAPYP